MSDTMRAVQVARAGGELELVTLPIPEPGAGQVRIKVEACGVCAGDDITVGGHLPIQYPRTPGHEVAGYVDKLGEGISNWQVGDRVGVGFHGGHCFVCDPCRQGDFVNCFNSKITGASFDGGYAEYLVAPQDALARIPQGLSAELAGPLMCAGVTTYNALRNSTAKPGEVVAVLGLGGLGHLAVQYAAKSGFNTVAIARGAAREKVALELGADRYIDSTTSDPATILREMGGAQVVLATAPSGEAITGLLGGLAPNGTIIIAAAPHEPLSVPVNALLFGKKSIQGWYSGHAKDSEDAMSFSALRDIRPRVEIYSLERAAEAYRAMQTGQANFRAVIKP